MHGANKQLSWPRITTRASEQTHFGTKVIRITLQRDFTYRPASASRPYCAQVARSPL
jgi:hypothetical protein